MFSFIISIFRSFIIFNYLRILEVNSLDRRIGFWLIFKTDVTEPMYLGTKSISMLAFFLLQLVLVSEILSKPLNCLEVDQIKVNRNLSH
jgi:hypothetical protein